MFYEKTKLGLYQYNKNGGKAPILLTTQFIIVFFLIHHYFQPHFHRLLVDKIEQPIDLAQTASTSVRQAKFVKNIRRR